MCGEGELKAEAFSLEVKPTSSHGLRVDLLPGLHAASPVTAPVRGSATTR